MKAIDTNVLLRALVGDDPVQSPLAARAIEAGVVVPLTVLLEAAWVLQTLFRYERERVALVLGLVLDMPSAHVADEPSVRWALDRYRRGADIADMLHLVAAAGADAFLTFDRDLVRRVGGATPIMPELIAS